MDYHTCALVRRKTMLEDHIVLTSLAPVAQLVEQVPFKDKVPRSIRGGRTK